MIFEEILSSYFYMLTDGRGCYSERSYFDKLEDALLLTASRKSYLEVFKGVTSSVVFQSLSGTTVSCMMPHILLLTFSRRKKECRAAYLQSAVQLPQKMFKMDAAQLELMQRRPELSFTSNRFSVAAGGPRALASNCYQSITGFLLFEYQRKMGLHEIHYAAADAVQGCDPGTGQRQQVQIRSVGLTPAWESAELPMARYLNTLEEFGAAVRKLQVGAPVGANSTLVKGALGYSRLLKSYLPADMVTSSLVLNALPLGVQLMVVADTDAMNRTV